MHEVFNNKKRDFKEKIEFVFGLTFIKHLFNLIILVKHLLIEVENPFFFAAFVVAI